MECSSQSSAWEIEILLGKVNALLEENDEAKWAAYGKDLLDNFVHLTHSKTKKEAVIAIKKALTAGMGGFTDIVLYKDGQVLVEENDEIRKLWELLYEQCKFFQYGKLSARKAATFVNSQYHTFEIIKDNEYVLYRAGTSKNPMGKFFIDESVVENKEGVPYKMYRLNIPKGTLVRCGDVAPVEGVLLKSGNQIFIDKPWLIPGFEVVPVDTVEKKS
jgi:hypothetical protein